MTRPLQGGFYSMHRCGAIRSNPCRATARVEASPGILSERQGPTLRPAPIVFPVATKVASNGGPVFRRRSVLLRKRPQKDKKAELWRKVGRARQTKPPQCPRRRPSPKDRRQRGGRRRTHDAHNKGPRRPRDADHVIGCGAPGPLLSADVCQARPGAEPWHATLNADVTHGPQSPGSPCEPSRCW